MTEKGERMMVRRLGSGVIHLADVPEDLLVPAKVFGAPCSLVVPPVAALCRAELRGDVVVMRPDQKISCRTCSRFSEFVG